MIDFLPGFMYDYAPFDGGYNYAYYLTHPHRFVIDLSNRVKWFWQRGKRGYADCDVWSIDWHLTSYMGNALRQLRDSVHGCPIIDTGREMMGFDDCDSLTMEEWKFTINYIAETFDLARKIEEYEILGVKDMEAAMKRFHHGMAMFNEYFFSLWD